MPKKRSVKSWRKSEAGEEFREAVENDVNNAALNSVTDDKLFVIDTSANEKVKKLVVEDIEMRKFTENEKRAIRKIMKKKNSSEVVKSKRSKPEISDIWGSTPKTETKKDEWVTEDDLSIPKKSKHPRKIIKSSYPAVKIPIPGASYNPDPVQHQDAIGEALAEDIHLEEKMNKEYKLPKGVDINALRHYKVNYSADTLGELADTDEEEEKEEETKEEEEGEGEKKEVNLDAPGFGFNAPVVVKRKTRAQRNREKKHEKLLRLHQRIKRANLHKHLLDNIETIDQNMKESSEKKKKDKKERQALQAVKDSKYEPPIIRSGKKVEEKPRLDIYLSDELPASMREMTPVANPLYDRIASLEKRRLFEKGQQLKKSQLVAKRTTKNKYKSPFVKE
ncbi:hypothetical protein WA158_001654 [Blastocystis sp. Blastoise]